MSSRIRKCERCGRRTPRGTCSAIQGAHAGRRMYALHDFSARARVGMHNRPLQLVLVLWACWRRLSACLPTGMVCLCIRTNPELNAPHAMMRVYLETFHSIVTFFRLKCICEQLLSSCPVCTPAASHQPRSKHTTISHPWKKLRNSFKHLQEPIPQEVALPLFWPHIRGISLMLCPQWTNGTTASTANIGRQARPLTGPSIN